MTNGWWPAVILCTNINYNMYVRIYINYVPYNSIRYKWSPNTACTCSCIYYILMCTCYYTILCCIHVFFLRRWKHPLHVQTIKHGSYIFVFIFNCNNIVLWIKYKEFGQNYSTYMYSEVIWKNEWMVLQFMYVHAWYI